VKLVLVFSRLKILPILVPVFPTQIFHYCFNNIQKTSFLAFYLRVGRVGWHRKSFWNYIFGLQRTLDLVFGPGNKSLIYGTNKIFYAICAPDR